jgi:O-antigen/teichoic acid export membrane protein
MVDDELTRDAMTAVLGGGPPPQIEGPPPPRQGPPPRLALVERKRDLSMAAMLRGAAGTIVLQAGSYGMGFVISVILARHLSTSGYGLYAFASAWVGLLTVPAVLGLDRFVVRGLARYEVEQRWALAHGLLRRANEISLLASTLIAGAGCLVAVTCLSPELRTPFCVAMALIPITSLTLIRQAAMQAMGRVVSGQLPEYLIRPVLILVGVAVLGLVGGGALTATTALLSAVAGTGVACAVGAVRLRHVTPSALRYAPPQYLTREWLRSSLRMMLIGGIWLANAYTGIVVVGTIAGRSAAGVFSVVDKGAALIAMALVATNMPLAPAIARLAAIGDAESLQRTVERVARLGFVVSIPVCAAFAIFPGVYLSLFGSGFQDGTTAMRILALGQVFNAAAGPCGNVLIMSGHERSALLGMSAGLLLNLVLAVILVPPLGVTGGAIAFAISLIVWNALFVLAARRHVGINATAFHWLTVKPPGANHA